MRKFLLTIVFSLVLFLVLNLTTLSTVSASNNTTVEYNFKELSNLDDFQAIYTTKSNGGVGQIVEFSDYWTLDNNGLTSINPTISGGSTDNISYLSLTKYVFTNFEAEFAGKFLDTNSWGWMGLVFRQETIGRGFFDEGCFVGVQKEGTALIWGSDLQGSGPFEGSKPSSIPQTEKIVKVRVIGKEVTITVMDIEGEVISEVSNTVDSRELTNGYISIASIDNHHTFSTLKITNLDENGNANELVSTKKMEQIEVLNKPTTMSINETLTLNYNISEDDENYKKVKISSSNHNVVIASGNLLTAVGAGTAEIKVSSSLDSSNYVTFEVIVTSDLANDGKITYVLNTLKSLENFKHNYVLDASGNNAGDYDEYDTYWQYSEEYAGVMRVNDQSNDPANDIATLLIGNQKFTNFEMTLVYQNTNANSGWIGFVGLHDKSDKRFMDHGFGAFVQSEGYPTIWGQGTGIHEQKNVIYDSTSVHILRVKVYAGLIELYLDDMINPSLSYEIGSDMTNAGGEIGVFCSGEGYVIKSISYAYLNEDGTVNNYYRVSEFTVTGVPTEAKVGESYNVQTTINNDATIQTIIMTSSDSNVCIAKNGKLTFISSGEVTITIYPEDAPELAKEFLIVVEEPDNTENPDLNNSDTNNNENNTDSNQNSEPAPNVGCSGSSTAVLFITIGVLALLCAISVIFIKKKANRG